MTCPSCNQSLYSLNSESTIGTRISLDHCGNCGGTWFDPNELFSLPHYEVVRLAKMTVSNRSLSNLHFSKDELLCPRDRAHLITLDTDTTPKDLRFFECPRCHGIWGTAQALSHFAQSVEKNSQTDSDHEKIFPDTTISLAPLLALTLLFFATFVTLYSFKKTQENRTQAQTLITSISTIPIGSTTILLSLRTSVAVTSEISYGTSRLTMINQIIDTKPGTIHQITLNKLSPNTPYIYTLTLTDALGNSYTTPVYVFRTK